LGNISGATSSSYTISSVVTNDAGSYRCVVTNAYGADYSLAAILTVLPLVGIEFADISRLSDNRVRLVGTGGTGTYLIEFAPNLMNWQALFSVTNTSGSFEFIDEETNAVRRFYRAKMLP
jgi:hypothetical protein